MIRPVTCICMLLALGSGLALYQEKHRAQLQERRIVDLRKQAAAVREQTGILRGEYMLLNDPQRLQDLASRHLPTLQPMQPTHYVQLAQLDQHLPAPLPAEALRRAPPPAPTQPTPVDPSAGVPIAQAAPGSASGSVVASTAAPAPITASASLGSPPAVAPRILMTAATALPRAGAVAAGVVPPAGASAPAGIARVDHGRSVVAPVATTLGLAPHAAERGEGRHDAARPRILAPVVTAFAEPSGLGTQSPPVPRRAPTMLRAEALAPMAPLGAPPGRFGAPVPAIGSALGAAHQMMAPPVPIAAAGADYPGGR